jgi:hypothetical protein
MKLVGSKVEQDFRHELIASKKKLYVEGGSQRLLEELRKHFENLETAYILDWIPEQGEDIYIKFL